MKALVVPQPVDEHAPGVLQALFRELLELVPGKDDIVAVHQQIFRPLGLGASPIGLCRGVGLGRAHGLGLIPADGTIGALEDLHELLVCCHDGAILRRQVPKRRLLHRRLQGAGQVHMFRHLVPLDVDSRTVAAENAVGAVIEIRLRVIAQGFHHLLLVFARLVAPEGTADSAKPPGVGCDGLGIVLHGRHRRRAGEHRLLPHYLGRVEARAHLLQVRHGSSHISLGQLQSEVVPGFQKHALGLHQTLAHRPVGGLAEVAALGVLQMRLA